MTSPGSPAISAPFQGAHPGRFWHRDGDRLICDLCPRACAMHPGQRGACFVRGATDEGVALLTWGRSSGFCVDPIEKKPLNHFLPGTPVLSFGTAGCNLACKFCQNWDISKSRDMDRLMDRATPDDIVNAAVSTGSRSVAFTYNDPVIFAEYALDVAAACREADLSPVAVTAGYIGDTARAEFFAGMDAANVDLKGFTDRFYEKVCGGRLAPVKETLRHLIHGTSVHTEITTLLIPDENDSDAEIAALSTFVARELSPDVPLHFTAYHPDWKMQRPETPPATLRRARRIAQEHGLRYVYTGNIRDPDGQSTRCPACARTVIRRDGYHVGDFALIDGACPCGHRIPGRFEARPGTWGARRLPIAIG